MTSQEEDLNSLFYNLLQFIQQRLEDTKDEIWLATDRGDYEKVQLKSEQAKQLTIFLSKVQQLREEGVKLLNLQFQPYRKSRRNQRRRSSQGFKLSPGLRTPEQDFICPILQALVELGGSAPKARVIDRVGEIMKPVLKDVDYKLIPSAQKGGRQDVRWRNAATWCRSKLCDQGLMSRGTKGIWAITDAGREYLRSHCTDE